MTPSFDQAATLRKPLFLHFLRVKFSVTHVGRVHPRFKKNDRVSCRQIGEGTSFVPSQRPTVRSPPQDRSANFRITRTYNACMYVCTYIRTSCLGRGNWPQPAPHCRRDGAMQDINAGKILWRQSIVVRAVHCSTPQYRERQAGRQAGRQGSQIMLAEPKKKISRRM